MPEYILESPTKSSEICSLTMVRRVAAMLDLETKSFEEGDVLPKGWHFFMLAGQTRKSELRVDGFPGLGVPMPDLNLPRVLLGGRTVSYNGDIWIGSVVEKISFVKNIVEKTTKNGAMAIVTIQHELRPISAINPAIIETQTYILLEESKVKNKEKEVQKNQDKVNQIISLPIGEGRGGAKQFTPDETLLFQYSALGFNSHKIHLDRSYAQNVEGLPDLVVNGGLTTLLLTEFMRTDLGINLTEIKVKHIAPLFCNRPLTIAFEKDEINIYDENNEIAVVVETRYALSL